MLMFCFFVSSIVSASGEGVRAASRSWPEAGGAERPRQRLRIAGAFVPARTVGYAPEGAEGGSVLWATSRFGRISAATLPSLYACTEGKSELLMLQKGISEIEC